MGENVSIGNCGKIKITFYIGGDVYVSRLRMYTVHEMRCGY